MSRGEDLFVDPIRFGAGDYPDLQNVDAKPPVKGRNRGREERVLPVLSDTTGDVQVRSQRSRSFSVHYVVPVVPSLNHRLGPEFRSQRSTFTFSTIHHHVRTRPP